VYGGFVRARSEHARRRLLAMATRATRSRRFASDKEPEGASLRYRWPAVRVVIVSGIALSLVVWAVSAVVVEMQQAPGPTVPARAARVGCLAHRQTASLLTAFATDRTTGR
jgi:hypothetical protein